MTSLSDNYWQKFDPVDSMDMDRDQFMAPVFSKPERPRGMPALNLGGMPPSL